MPVVAINTTVIMNSQSLTALSRWKRPLIYTSPKQIARIRAIAPTSPATSIRSAGLTNRETKPMARRAVNDRVADHANSHPHVSRSSLIGLRYIEVIRRSLIYIVRAIKAQITRVVSADHPRCGHKSVWSIDLPFFPMSCLVLRSNEYSKIIG